MENRRISLISFLVLCLSIMVVPPASAGFDWTGAVSAGGAVGECMAAKVPGSLLESVRSHGRPERRGDRRKIKHAWRECETLSDAVQALPVYEGPLIDAMAQFDSGVSIEKRLREGMAEGVVGFVLFVRSFRTVGESEGSGLSLREDFPRRVALGTPKFFNMRGDLDPYYVDQVIKGIGEHDYRVVGEIMYAHGDKVGGEVTGSGERYLSPLGPETERLLKGLAPLNVPVQTHWEVYDWERDRPAFEQLYKRWPDQLFIIPHMAFGSVEQVEDILSSHPNVMMTLSKKERRINFFADKAKEARLGASMFRSKEGLKPEWRDLIIRYRDRILFATDAHKRQRWKTYKELVRTYRRVLGGLPPDVAEDVAWKNAARVYRFEPSLVISPEEPQTSGPSDSGGGLEILGF
ncbi:MAG: amidohydrolase family protein [Gammaproteobacteria bacterium]